MTRPDWRKDADVALDTFAAIGDDLAPREPAARDRRTPSTFDRDVAQAMRIVRPRYTPLEPLVPLDDNEPPDDWQQDGSRSAAMLGRVLLGLLAVIVLAAALAIAMAIVTGVRASATQGETWTTTSRPGSTETSTPSATPTTTPAAEVTTEPSSEPTGSSSRRSATNADVSVDLRDLPGWVWVISGLGFAGAVANLTRGAYTPRGSSGRHARVAPKRPNPRGRR